MSTYKLACPHCAARIRIRSSEGLHPLIRTLYIQCTSEACGWTGVASLEITHELSASSQENPQIQLEQAPIAIRRKAISSATGDDDQTDLFDEFEDELESKENVSI